MAKLFSVRVNGEKFPAKPGELLLEAALRSGVDLPHDCRAGHCGACTVRCEDGFTLGGETGEQGCVRACQARIFSDLELAIEEKPMPCRVDGEIAALQELAEDIVEISIKLRQAFDWLPGQYCNVQFRGFPARSFSPTACMATGRFDRFLRFHIKRVRGGRVTSELGNKIAVGHRVRIEGPFGSAHHRPGQSNRLVLAGSGTGFAPIWAIAAAALSESKDRAITLICGTKNSQSFYMASALVHAARHSRVSVVPTIEKLNRPSAIIAEGTPAHHLPQIAADDIVYAAGSPRMVGEVELAAKKAGATFYADPFETGAKQQANLLRQLISVASVASKLTTRAA